MWPLYFLEFDTAVVLFFERRVARLFAVIPGELIEIEPRAYARHLIS
jgi:hypothetical protein